jgi:predicted Holliday junction resolvase-like endonuclease
MVAALIVLSAVVLVLLVLVLYLWNYRATHPHTEDDLQRKSEASKTRSRQVLLGQVGEQLAPLWPEFAEKYNLRDARFIGQPIDFIVFEGLEDGEVRKIVFVEVKTGNSQLTKRERLVQKAIESGNVAFDTISLQQGST